MRLFSYIIASIYLVASSTNLLLKPRIVYSIRSNIGSKPRNCFANLANYILIKAKPFALILIRVEDSIPNLFILII